MYMYHTEMSCMCTHKYTYVTDKEGKWRNGNNLKIKITFAQL